MNSGPDGMWPMFLFGFLGVFVVTQMHGLGLGIRTRWSIGLGYLAAAVGVYGSHSPGDLHEIVRIPHIEYLLVAVMGTLIWLGLLPRRRPAQPGTSSRCVPTTESSRSASSDGDPGSAV
ncbi:hypothetical protein ACPZ19_06720 [Amycolatopsis lurida]